MNNKGIRNNSSLNSFIQAVNELKQTYIYKLISKILTVLLTIILVGMLCLGALLFYYNRKATSFEKQGIEYNPPIGLYTIVSGSMVPTINVYDVVATTEVKDISSLKVGDVITFISTWDLNYGVTVTHRISDITKTSDGEYQITTKGDNNLTEDGSFVNQSNLIGKVVFKVPQLGRLQFFLATKMGWFMVVFIPALLVVIYDIIKILKLVFLKETIKNVATVGESQKIFYGDEILENREIDDLEFEKTKVISSSDVEKLKNAKDNMTKEYSDGLTRTRKNKIIFKRRRIRK